MKDFLKLTGIAVAGVVVVGVAISTISIITSPFRTVAGVINRTMDPDNVLATYERFHDRWKGYESRLAQVRSTQQMIAAETDQAELRRMRMELAAQRQSCRDIAAGYNADAAKTNRVIFQGREAPTTLNMEVC